MTGIHWERLEPAQPCASPDGHDWVDAQSLSSPAPDHSVCLRCAAVAEIVVFDGPRTRDA